MNINRGLVRALDAVGDSLFGRRNFGASIVGSNPPDDGSPVPQAVQIDLASGNPPDDGIPVLLNVFQRPDPASLNPVCTASAQIAVTADGVRVIINPDVMGPTGGALVAGG